MKTAVISLRLPSAVVADLETIAAYNRVSVAVVLDWFLCTSLSKSEVLRWLQDCEEHCDRKLDARIPYDSRAVESGNDGPGSINYCLHSQALVPLFCHQTTSVPPITG